MSLTLVAALSFQAHANANLKNFHTRPLADYNRVSQILEIEEQTRKTGTTVRETLKQWTQKNNSFYYCGNPLLRENRLKPGAKGEADPVPKERLHGSATS